MPAAAAAVVEEEVEAPTPYPAAIHLPCGPAGCAGMRYAARSLWQAVDALVPSRRWHSSAMGPQEPLLIEYALRAASHSLGLVRYHRMASAY